MNIGTKNKIGRLLGFINHIQNLTPRAIKAFYAELRKSYSKEYVKNIHGVLKRALRLAYTESGLLPIVTKITIWSAAIQEEDIKPKRITEGMDVLVSKAGVKKIRFHDQRHTHASFLLMIGINPKVAAERLGMTPAMFNERYSHLLPIIQEEAVDRIENELNKFAQKQLELVDK